jgi:hypothetical protein
MNSARCTLSRSVASIFAAVIVVIVVVCPAGLIHIQSEKSAAMRIIAFAFA